MGVCHFKAKHHLCYFAAGECLLDGYGNAFGKLLVAAYLVVVHIEDVINFAAGNHQGVTFHQRVNVEECVELVVLSALVAGYFASSDF